MADVRRVQPNYRNNGESMLEKYTVIQHVQSVEICALYFIWPILRRNHIERLVVVMLACFSAAETGGTLSSRHIYDVANG